MILLSLFFRANCQQIVFHSKVAFFINRFFLQSNGKWTYHYTKKNTAETTNIGIDDLWTFVLNFKYWPQLIAYLFLMIKLKNASLQNWNQLMKLKNDSKLSNTCPIHRSMSKYFWWYPLKIRYFYCELDRIFCVCDMDYLPKFITWKW